MAPPLGQHVLHTLWKKLLKNLHVLICHKDKGTAGVGVFVAEEWTEKVFEVQRVSDRIILVKLSRPACGYLSVCVCPTEWSK